MENVSIVLGTEYDNDLQENLIRVLNTVGALHTGTRSAVVGSQDIWREKWRLDDEDIDLVSATFCGLSITGRADIVERICSLLNGSG